MDIQFLETLKEFIQFKIFIAEDVLTVFYLFFAILIPITSWYFLFWLIRRYAVLISLYKSGRYSIFFSIIVWFIRKIKFFRDKIDEKITWLNLNSAQRLKFISLYVLLVFFAELFLRLTFEYLIAFIQMHEWMKPLSMQ